MATAALVDHALELLAPLGAARARRMFGGWGVYLDDLFVAIIVEERLCLKTDASTAPRFEAAGCAPWIYEVKGRRVPMSYWTVPAEAMESPVAMRPWARLAIEAALRARAAKAAAPRTRARAAASKGQANAARKVR
jgi:DNA transformation protein